MFSSQITKLDLDISASVTSFEKDSRRILKQIRPNWDTDKICFKVFTDGFMNSMFGCYVEDNVDDIILIRIYGQGTEILINREEELEAFGLLSAAGCAPPLYCAFNNGMAYGFFPGIPLDSESVQDPKIQRLIAKELVRIHTVQGPRTSEVPPKSEYKKKALSWLEAIPSHYDDPTQQIVFEKEIPPKAELKNELDEIVRTLEGLNMDVVFSHNDTFLKNIIYNEQEETIHFIDYEYASYNYEAFDIGNHFAEFGGVDKVNYNPYQGHQYPDKNEQFRWLRNYLEYKHEAEGSPAITEQDVERLYVQTNKCACASHFLWTLWALVQTQYSLIPFNFLQYASSRMTEYYKRKKEFFHLELPTT
ncbi:ethanolamine kinase 1-like [Biomphalaria glabrata]|uniref:ethanolamine kinase n=1 Tax=Biomphalaria glabrata TaxID=6526 RepID=A0A9W3BLV7_BIOGL|nr:ethanolamine kinase 1-like [Biomphalaria glabrata]XP_055900404.1 ethanolamine kinase 1-like [Biomphalaria glabrata]